MAVAFQGPSVVKFGFALAAFTVLTLVGLRLSGPPPSRPAVNRQVSRPAKPPRSIPTSARVAQRIAHSAAGHITRDASLERFLAPDVLAALAPEQRLEALVRHEDVHERMIADYEQKLAEPDPEGRHDWYADQLQQARSRLGYIRGQIVACRRELGGVPASP